MIIDIFFCTVVALTSMFFIKKTYDHWLTTSPRLVSTVNTVISFMGLPILIALWIVAPNNVITAAFSATLITYHFGKGIIVIGIGELVEVSDSSLTINYPKVDMTVIAGGEESLPLKFEINIAAFRYFLHKARIAKSPEDVIHISCIHRQGCQDTAAYKREMTKNIKARWEKIPIVITTDFDKDATTAVKVRGDAFLSLDNSTAAETADAFYHLMVENAKLEFEETDSKGKRRLISQGSCKLHVLNEEDK